jgi:diguanylate cyclase (GGDEF)-like protein
MGDDNDTQGRWAEVARESTWSALRHPGRKWGRRWLRDLDAEDRAHLTAVQVAATRPAFTAVLMGGAAMLAVTATFEVLGLAPGIGWPPWLVVAAALAVAVLAWFNWRVRNWRWRLVAMLLATATIGVFLSVPKPGTFDSVAQFPIRTGLFHLIPIALLALTVRASSVVLLVAVVVALAAVRLSLYGAPPSGEALYWLYTATTIAFGLMLSGYRTDFAVEAFRVRRLLWKQAATDALTGLSNRAGWERDATPVYEGAGARGAPRSLVFFDVDRFKDINDRYGHASGDEVLRVLGAAISARLGPDSYAARMGGEEFIVLQIDAVPAAVERYAQRVRADFAEANAQRRCTLSAGIAFAAPGESLADGMRRADAALYAAKEAGRDRIVIAP